MPNAGRALLASVVASAALGACTSFGVGPTDALAADAGADAELEAAPDVDAEPFLTVFVTSAVYTGKLGGLAGADAKCMALAAGAGLLGTFVAWLSDHQTSAATRLSPADLPYRLVDGTLVASGPIELVSGTLRHAIDKTESNGSPPFGTNDCGFGPRTVWTETNGTGGGPCNANAAQACLDWTSDAPSPTAYGSLGDSTEASAAWSCGCGSGTCDKTAALYCFER
jgi:hypothetical protein